MAGFKKVTLFFIVSILLIEANFSVSAQTGTFARGADVSWVSQMVSQGIPFYNTSGVQENLFQVLQGNCINAIRLRVWVNPAAPGWNGQADVVNKAVEAAAAGYRILIDFHYSDTWADPGDQNKPAAWANYTMAQLTQAVSMHTNSVLSALSVAGVTPEWVQVGNETNDGMLWPVNTGDPGGRVSVNGFASFAQLINSGYSAVKAVFPNAKVIIHISNGYDNALFEWMFDGLKAAGANWDVIGMSLYPSTTDYTTLDAECLANMQDMITRYNKPVMNCEVGMAVNDPTDSEAFLTDIINKNSSLGSMGLGVFYWEPESYNNWQGYAMGAFGNNGEPTAAMNAFGTGCAVQTPTNTANVTATNTATNTSTATATNTATYTPTHTATKTATNTSTNTITNTPTSTATHTATNTATNTITNTSTATATNTKTNTATNTATSTVTNTSSSTATHTPANTATNTITNTDTPTATNTSTSVFTSTFTNTATNTPTPTATLTATNTSTKTATSTTTNTPTNTTTKTATDTPTNTETSTATLTATHSPANTATNTMTNTPTITATNTLTATQSSTPTGTKTNTPTLTSTNTPTSTFTNTLTPRPTSTSTYTPTITPTYTSTISPVIVISVPFPNPSSGSPITFNVQTPDQSTVTVEVFTLAFRKIFSETIQVNGSQNIQWGLKDTAGVQVANGVYYIRVQVSGNPSVTKILKVLILR